MKNMGREVTKLPLQRGNEGKKGSPSLKETFGKRELSFPRERLSLNSAGEKLPERRHSSSLLVWTGARGKTFKASKVYGWLTEGGPGKRAKSTAAGRSNKACRKRKGWRGPFPLKNFSSAGRRRERMEDGRFRKMGSPLAREKKRGGMRSSCREKEVILNSR